MKESSRIMRLFASLGFQSLAWAFRRFHTPVSREALVLEVGSGGNPYPRSNVLLDAYESTRERHWVPLTSDRPTVLGFVENLPFKDKSFDYVIASHVLEHSGDPEKFISELQRVAKAGYIEVPDAFLERINPYKDHRLEITLRGGVLVITKKVGWIHDSEVVDLYEDRVKVHLTKILVPQRPFEFHVRYYWSGEIQYLISNPEVDATWEPPHSIEVRPSAGTQSVFKDAIRNTLRFVLSQNSRNAQIDIRPLLKCTKCLSGSLSQDSSQMVCSACRAVYPIRAGIFVMNE
jgi:SAM-dependent methyltransferase